VWVTVPVLRSKTQAVNKHVESVAALCPDAGSTPASSTKQKPKRLEINRLGFFFLSAKNAHSLLHSGWINFFALPIKLNRWPNQALPFLF
jgi:hypothetical protein